MRVLNGLDRNWITFSSLGYSIAGNDEVRFTDAFDDKKDMKQLDVQSPSFSENHNAGSVSFRGALSLKLYLYNKRWKH